MDGWTIYDTWNTMDYISSFRNKIEEKLTVKY